MTNERNTKRSLLLSIVVLLLCFTMFIGSTFAWFVDSAATNSNKIQAGTLDVDLLMANPSTGNYSSIAGVNAAIFGAASLIAKNDPACTLWEPGKTQIVYLAVDNKESNLDLKYTILLNVVDGGLIGSLEYAIVDGAKYGDITAASWAEVKAIDDVQTGDVAAGTLVAAPNGIIKADEGMEYFALAIHMKETAGTEYQGKNITIDVNVLATQLSSEADVFGNTYDQEADDLYIVDAAAGKYIATSEKGLSAAAKLASTNDSITSVTYVTDAGVVEAPIVRDTDSLQAAINAKNSAVVLTKGAFVAALQSIPSNSRSLTIVGAGADTTIQFDNNNVDLSRFDKLTISNCNIGRMYKPSRWGHVTYSSSSSAGGVYTISDCIFNGVNTQGIYINQKYPATFNVVNCIFDGENGNFGEGVITIQNNEGIEFTLNVIGCEFKNITGSPEITVKYAYDGWTLNAPGVSAFWEASNTTP